MANKKAAPAKKATKKTTRPAAAPAKEQTKTKVTTVKAASAGSRRAGWLGQLNLSNSPLLGAALAELAGTFLLVVLLLITHNEPLYMMFGLAAIALTVAVMSGAHLNPAVSVGAWVNRKISGLRTLAYVLAQVVGAMLAFVVVSAYVNAAPEVSQEAAMFGQQQAQIFTASDIPDGKQWGMFFAELLGLTAVGFAYASAYQRRQRVLGYALTIGGGLFTGLLLAGGFASYLTGTAVLNPAAAISVQALDWQLWPLLVYVVAPLVGGIIGFGLHKLLATGSPAAVPADDAR